MDRMEEFRKGCHSQQIRLRPVHQAEKLPPEGLSKIDLHRVLRLDLHLVSYVVVIFNLSCMNIYSSTNICLPIHLKMKKKIFSNLIERG